MILGGLCVLSKFALAVGVWCRRRRKIPGSWRVACNKTSSINYLSIHSLCFSWNMGSSWWWISHNHPSAEPEQLQVLPNTWCWELQRSNRRLLSLCTSATWAMVNTESILLLTVPGKLGEVVGTHRATNHEDGPTPGCVRINEPGKSLTFRVLTIRWLAEPMARTFHDPTIAIGSREMARSSTS